MKKFNVCNVTRINGDRRYKVDSKKNLENIVGMGVEASSVADGTTYSTNNFVAAINTAYDQHLPLVLSPDMIWLTLAQGLSRHVMENAEELRHQFVNFEGKEKIIVYEDYFVKGSSDNNWAGTFGKFSDGISNYIGKKRDLVVSNFSTTGPVERAASEIVLMEAMSKYFDYECHTMCGIPEITLLGELEDWKNIQTRVRAMAEYDLSWWTQKLEPIVDQFVNAYQGNVDKKFWNELYKMSDGSGGPYISGWITNLYPYLTNARDEFRKNPFKDSGMFDGLTTSNFPIGMSKVPFLWKYYDQEFEMELAAGFTGFKEESDGSVVPQIGWAVREDLINKVSFSFEEGNDWKHVQAQRNMFLNALQEFDFKLASGSWGSTITGLMPKVQIKNVDIPGLKRIE